MSEIAYFLRDAPLHMHRTCCRHNFESNVLKRLLSELFTPPNYHMINRNQQGKLPHDTAGIDEYISKFLDLVG